MEFYLPKIMENSLPFTNIPGILDTYIDNIWRILLKCKQEMS